MAVAAAARRSVNVIMLGRMGFIPALDLQTRYAREHLDQMAGKPNACGKDTLLLVEHSPVYTVGIRTKDYTKEDVEQLKLTGAQFYTTNRGGLITFHGPGQLVAYPILNLTRFKPSMKWYVSQLEKTLVDTLGQFGLKGRLTDNTGVWVEDRKIASIGLHGSRYVTTHGISLNCNTELDWFRHIVPCGLQDVEMTSLTQELGHNTTIMDAAKPFLKSFQENFDCELEYRMLDREDLKNLDSSVLPRDTNSTVTEVLKGSQAYPGEDAASALDKAASSTSVETLSKSKLDSRRELGLRMMSTLTTTLSQSPSPLASAVLTSASSSSSSSSSSSASLSPTAYSSSHVTMFSPTSSLSANNNSCCCGCLAPPFRKKGPMW